MTSAMNQMELMIDIQAPRKQLLKSLKGRVLHIPNLQALMSHWPQYVNPELERLREDVDNTLRNLFPDSTRLRKMSLADPALFAASWWPYASFQRLKIATYLSIWLFAWDDETDSAEFSSLVSDLHAARMFREETVGYMTKCLSGGHPELDTKRSSNTIIEFFGTFGKTISSSCTAAMTDVEQEFQLSGMLPTADEYRQRRMGSSAVGVCLAISEYAFGIDIPRHIMAEDDMKTLWTETNVIISTVNDILSVKKEMHGTLERSMNEVVADLKRAIANLELAARQLLDRHSNETAVLPALEKFIHGCKCACTANMNWSLISGRYKLGRRSLHGGVEIML
ncbi:MAG: hypothetical protein Q9193_000103 [Seirophora villosa]